MEVDAKRLVIGLSLVFLLGILFAVVNGSYASEAGEPLPLIVYGISVLSVMVGAAVVLVFQWRISRAQLDRVLSLLPREERLIVKTLLDNDGRLEQNRMVALTGLSKVQVSRSTKHLVERGVLDKRRLGNTNLLVLKL